jgi:glutaredoxin-dependent peroxiredoxin
MPIKKLDKSPGFTLFDSTKNKITLSDYQDKKNVLLLFFPLAFTSTCTKELCSVRDDIGKYDNETTQVFGISVDAVFSLAKFSEEQAYNYPLLSDFNKEASAAFDCLYPSFGAMDMHGVSKRAAFIIDRDGIVQYAEVLEDAREVPDFTAIDAVLKQLA